MKLPIVCMQCAFPFEGTKPDYTIYSTSVRDDCLYGLTCRHGHKTTTVVQDEKFEILFEIALNAIVDGYYRDAIASASSGLERFYEFFVRVICRAHKIPAAEYERAWKHVRSASERQIGLFVAAHTLHYKKAPTLMWSDRVGFRNEVIHKGRIPLREEAIEYANEVLNLIMPVLVELKKWQGETIREVVAETFKSRTSKLPQTSAQPAMTIASVIGLSVANTDQQVTSIDARLIQIEKRKYRG